MVPGGTLVIPPPKRSFSVCGLFQNRSLQHCQTGGRAVVTCSSTTQTWSLNIITAWSPLLVTQLLLWKQRILILKKKKNLVTIVFLSSFSSNSYTQNDSWKTILTKERSPSSICCLETCVHVNLEHVIYQKTSFWCCCSEQETGQQRPCRALLLFKLHRPSATTLALHFNCIKRLNR